jgi:hypothetical protein
MKFHLRRVLTKLAGVDVLTHTLPYEARFVARRG